MGRVVGTRLACARCRGLVVLSHTTGEDGSTLRQWRCLNCGGYSRGQVVSAYAPLRSDAAAVARTRRWNRERPAQRATKSPMATGQWARRQRADLWSKRRSRGVAL